MHWLSNSTKISKWHRLGQQHWNCNRHHNHYPTHLYLCNNEGILKLELHQACWACKSITVKYGSIFFSSLACSTNMWGIYTLLQLQSKQGFPCLFTSVVLVQWSKLYPSLRFTKNGYGHCSPTWLYILTYNFGHVWPEFWNVYSKVVCIF